MTARVVCLASPKGGSGKTMLTASLATFVGRLGKRVLIVDTDAATNGLTLLYLSQVVASRRENPHGGGLFDSGSNFSPEPSFVTIAEGVDLLPASFVGANTEDMPLDVFRARLGRILARVRDHYDLVLLDAQAGADEYAREALRPEVSDRVLIVSEYDPMSAAGVERLKALLGESVAYERTWIVLNKMLPEFAKSFSEFLEIVRYAPPIPWDADVVRAYARRRLALDFEFGNEHTVAIMRVLRTVLHDELAADLDEWAKKQADVLREPVEHTAAKLRDELATIERALQLSENRQTVQLWALLSLLSLLLALGFLLKNGWLAFAAAALGLVGLVVVLLPDIRRSRIFGKDDLVERRAAVRERLREYENVASFGLDELVSRRRR